MEPPSLPRFEATQRRDFLKRAAALGAVVLVPGLASCGSNDDKDAFADAPTTAAPTSGSGEAGSETTAEPASGEALPDGAALEVAFTYTAEGDGRGPARNPYVAVWVESAAGELVANISVWYNPPKGERWINNLASWFAADEAFVSANGSDDLEAKTGATRPAGTYTVSWDGVDASGVRATQGDYVVFVESAREHGPHSLTSAALTLGADGATAALEDNGELSAASASYTV